MVSTTLSGYCTPALCVLLLATSIVLFSGNAQADCYWPDGTENDRHQPCYSNHGGAIGLCCANGDICMSSGICMEAASDGSQSFTQRDEVDVGESLTLSSNKLLNQGQSQSKTYYRGSCMYRDWSQGENCPTVCLKGSGVSLHTDVGMIPCPGSDTNWYCADGNMKKANCSTGAYIVSLSKPSSFTTIGVSPSPSLLPVSKPPPSALSGTLTTTVTTAPGNTTAVASPTSSSAIAAGPPGSTTAPSPGSSSAPSSVPPSPSASAPPSNTSDTVPLAVGISIGGASIIIAGVLGYLIWRRRKKNTFARAETPPPRDMPDDGLNPVLSGPLFRNRSLLRRASDDYSHTIGGTGPSHSEPVPATSVLGSDRANSFHSGSMFSSLSQHNEYPQGQYGADAMAMHDMRHTTPPSWVYPRARNSANETIPEIPYDGRRLPPYYGTPILEHNGFCSELPG